MPNKKQNTNSKKQGGKNKLMTPSAMNKNMMKNRMMENMTDTEHSVRKRTEAERQVK
jgi:hypothetical protein